MFNKTAITENVNYFLRPGYIYLPAQPTVISTVLGSDVAVCIYDRKHKSGGMSRFQYPTPDKDQPPTTRFGDVATLKLIRMIMTEDTAKKHLEIQIFGGAHNPEHSPRNIGRENILVARRVLNKNGFYIVSEDVGGQKGRKVIFDTNMNEIAVLKVEKIRRQDWYPYEDNR